MNKNTYATLDRNLPGPRGTTDSAPSLPAWVSANRETGSKGGIDAETKPEHPPDWTAQDVAEWEAERTAIQWEGRPPEIRPNVDEDLGGPDPWEDATKAAPVEDFVPWEESPDPLDPHGKCSGLNCWWDLTGRQRCADCDPPNKARLLRATVATQRRRAVRRRLATLR
jgi:hypothetical protein